MSDAISSRRWRVLAETVPGAAHVRAGKPNQDAVRPEPPGHPEPPAVAVAAVADGHGSRRSIRSDRGARFAAEVTVELLSRYCGPDGRAVVDQATLRRDAEFELPQRIVLAWRELVDADLVRQPIEEAELEMLGEADRRALAGDPRVAYGSTVIGTLLLPEYSVYLQLGDGDVLVVNDRADEATRPLPADPRSFANETMSLCSPGAPPSGVRPGQPTGPWGDFRVVVVPTVAGHPALVLLTTDGYVNAFASDAAFRKVGTDLLSLVRSEGPAYVAGHLRDWLDEASRCGSGDDVTVAVLVRESARRPESEQNPPPAPATARPAVSEAGGDAPAGPEPAISPGADL